jgi:hypothetical protein
VGDPSSAPRHRMIDGLLAARADAQNLLRALDEIDKAATLTDATARKAETARAVKEWRDVYRRRDLTAQKERIEAARQEAPELGSDWGDELEVITNAIEDLPALWPDVRPGEGPLSPDEALARSKRTRAKLIELATASAKLTIRRRLEQNLAQRATGRALDFNVTFADEIPDAAVRKEYLAKLQEEEGRSFNGVVDVESGLIYVTSPSRWRRTLSYFAPLLTAVALGGILYGLSVLDVEWALDEWTPLFEGYVLVLAGMVVHLLVENVKQFEMGTPVIAVSDKLQWLHLRWVALSWSIVPAAITAVGLRFAELPGADQWETYLAAGYGADSLAGLFLTRYQAAAETGLKPIREYLTGRHEQEPASATGGS